MTRSVSLETASSVALIARQLGAVVSNEQIGEEYKTGKMLTGEIKALLIKEKIVLDPGINTSLLSKVVYLFVNY